MALSAKRIKNRNAQFEQKQKCCQTKNTAAKEPKDVTSDDEKVHLEFPYDDLELLYEYTLQKMGIKNPFKAEHSNQGKTNKRAAKRSGGRNS